MLSTGAPPPAKKKNVHVSTEQCGLDITLDLVIGSYSTYAHCNLCKTDICIAGGGQPEVDQHCKT